MTTVLTPPVSPPALPRAPTTDQDVGTDRAEIVRRIRRVSIVVGVAVIALLTALWVYERFVTQLMYDQRQRHLAAEFREAAIDATVREGEPIAVVQAESIDLNAIVIEGDSGDNLRGGPARRGSSALPGEPGRTVLLGHRSVFGGPFGRIDQLEQGTTVVVQTRNGGPIVAYVVREVRTGADAAEVEDPPDDVAQLVLVTSKKGWFDDDLVVVVASTLPVVEDATTGRTVAVDVGDRAFPLGFDALAANLSAAGVAFAWITMRKRVRSSLLAVALFPVAAFAFVSYLAVLDTILPKTR